MMDRRVFLKLTGFVAAAGVFGALPVAAQGRSDDAPRAAGPDSATQPLLPPGNYQFSGRVRLQEPLVEISGITNAQQISWSRGLAPSPVASFTSFEYFDWPWRMPEIRVRGGQLEALTVTSIDLG
jgi:hypothetical protein